MGGVSFPGWFKKEISVPKYTATKLVRKNLSKRLRANQYPGRYIHIMDEDMFNSVKQMIESDDLTNIEMAKDIIFKSKMCEDYINYFVKKLS